METRSFDEELLADHVADISIWLGGLMHEIKIPVQELGLKTLGGLIREGGLYAGHYATF